MTSISDISAEATSTKPYLLRALYDWCTDNGFTPYVAVYVNGEAVVPREYVKNGEIVLNLSFDATQALSIGNDALTFKARFSGVARDIYVPIDNIVAIYARENGQGMAFPLTPELQREQALGPKASEAVHGLKLATPEASQATDTDDLSTRSAPPENTPTPIKSARSARRPKLASDSQLIATDSVAQKAIPIATTAVISDKNLSAVVASKAKAPAPTAGKAIEPGATAGEATDAPGIAALQQNNPPDDPVPPSPPSPPSPANPPSGGRPALKRVK